jgi:hypothetical protein
MKKTATTQNWTKQGLNEHKITEIQRFQTTFAFLQVLLGYGIPQYFKQLSKNGSHKKNGDNPKVGLNKPCIGPRASPDNGAAAEPQAS